MKIWIYLDEYTGKYDICEKYEDAIGPDFVEGELPEDCVADFARTDMAYWTFQGMLGSMWQEGKKKGKNGKA